MLINVKSYFIVVMHSTFLEALISSSVGVTSNKSEISSITVVFKDSLVLVPPRRRSKCLEKALAVNDVSACKKI